MRNPRTRVPIIDKNGKHTNVYRVQKPEAKALARIRNINNPDRYRYELGGIEEGFINDLRGEFPRAHFFVDIQRHPDPNENADLMTIHHDLDPYDERSDDEILRLHDDFVGFFTGYLDTDELGIVKNRDDLLFLHASEIADRPTSIAVIEAKKEQQRNATEIQVAMEPAGSLVVYSREQAVSNTILDVFKRQKKEDGI